MPIFKDHKIQISDLLGVIPEALLSNLSQTTKVDHYSKVLHGRKLFYLLLFGILENDRLSQRSLEDTFNDPAFKYLFNLDQEERIRRSSISERLSKIDPNYFREIYECIYDQFASVYSSTEFKKYNLIRVDSTMVSETVGKLRDGFQSNQQGRKAVKYTISFDGILPADTKVFTTPSYSSEDIALPEAVLSHVKREGDHQNIYVLDRGLQSTKTMESFNKESVKFICRAKENRKYVEIESLMAKAQDLDMGESILIKDSKVQIYTGKKIENKRGKTHYQEDLAETNFRLVIVKSKTEKDKLLFFLTNDFKLTAKEVAQAYRRRWDIEVFFRFLKQELNLSHLVSLNKNGITVMIYMTLIVAMLVLLYKKANNIGFKTAKRRMTMEIRDLVIAMIIKQCGGDPAIYLKT